MAKNVLVLIITIFLLAGVGEIVLWLLFPVEDPYAEAKRDRDTHQAYIESQFTPNQRLLLYPEPDLPGMAPEVRFSTNNMGFRGADIAVPKPGHEYRIFMVGGSTTECLYLDDSATVTHALESFLNDRLPDSITARVYNAGKSGDRSYDHVAVIGQRLVHLEPDMIIVFCGINDLTASIYGADYLHLPTGRRRAVAFGNLVKYLLTEFQLPRRLYYLCRKFGAWGDEDDVLTAIPLKSDYKRKAALRKSQALTDAAPRIDLVPYRNNLTTIAGLTAAHGISLVFMTQATTWNSAVDPGILDWHWATFRNGIIYREEVMDQAINAYNDVMRDVAREHNTPVFEAALLLPKSREFFYDDCHFNIDGARKAAAMLGEFLFENHLIWD